MYFLSRDEELLPVFINSQGLHASPRLFFDKEIDGLCLALIYLGRSRYHANFEPTCFLKKLPVCFFRKCRSGICCREMRRASSKQNIKACCFVVLRWGGLWRSEIRAKHLIGPRKHQNEDFPICRKVDILIHRHSQSRIGFAQHSQQCSMRLESPFALFALLGAFRRPA